MQNIKTTIQYPLTSYKGSETTKALVEEQIIERYGKAELKNMDCEHNLRTFNSWLKCGYRVRKGEKALKSYTFLQETKNGELVLRKYYRRPVFLFYYRQVEPINPNHN
jgi:hypothetical protein